MSQAESLAQRQCQTQDSEPRFFAQRCKLAFRHDRPMIIVRTKAFRLKPVRRVFHSCKTASTIEQRVILLRFFSLPDTSRAVRMVGIIMVLMYSLDDSRSIHNARAGLTRMPHQPVVPAGTANHERRRILIVKAARKGEKVDPLRWALVIRFEGKTPHRRLPVRGVEVHRRSDIGVPTLTRHQESAAESGHALSRNAKIRKENDVAIDIAKEIVVREILRSVENRRKIFSAVLIALDAGNVANSEVAGGFGSALLVAEENHVGRGMNPLPTFDGITLNDADVPAKWLWRREKSNHSRTGLRSDSL